MNKKFYITTPIYYPTGDLHIGHAYTSTLADALARYKKAQGYDVYFLTGSDEHGQKIQEKAKAEGISEMDFLEDKVASFKNLWSMLHINYDQFIRTTDPAHKSTVQKIFSQLVKSGEAYKGYYTGKYCAPCESNWQLSQIEKVEGIYVCSDCKRPLKDVEEESYFLKLSDKSDFIKELYKKDFLIPKKNKTELLSKFIDPGLKDLSISRTTFNWGVKVKEDPNHVIYVWIDALSNYITALGYGSDNTKLFDKYWSDDTEILHLVGKEIIRFHAIYWPVILKNLNIMKNNITVMGHGWITSEGTKMSKSLGNVVNPIELINKYGAEHVRYYLAKEISTTNDGDFSQERFLQTYNTDLANKYGNLVSRTHSMIDKYFGGIIPNNQETKNMFDIKIKQDISHFYQQYTLSMDKYQVSIALKSAIALADSANQYISDTEPWNLAKEGKKIELSSVINNVVKAIEVVSFMLEPVLNVTAPKTFKQYGIAKPTLANILDFNKNNGVKISKKINLFPRLKKE